VYKADPKGDLHAREAVQDYYKKRGFIVLGENILLTSGTSESYLHILKVLSKNTSGVPDSQTEVLFPNPIYPLFEHIAELAGVKVRYYDLDAGKTAQVNTNVDWQIDLENLESKITPQTRAIVLVSPNNPTGSVLSEKTLESVLNIAQKHSISIVSDEVFSEFIFDGKKFPRIAEIAQNHAANVNIFTLNGISKTYALPGLKLSWVAATGPNTEDFIDQIELSVDTLLATNQISQAMLPTIMNDGEVFLSEFKKRLEESRNRAVKILEKNPNTMEHGVMVFLFIQNLVVIT
jgi:aspartate/methionine/tyrosine aminotransferase